MKSANYAGEEETTITGDLVNAINDVLDAPAATWMRFYSVHDDPPVNESRLGRNGRRKGKRRRRVDIRFDSSEQCPRARFRFECKRLGPGHSAKRYLGKDGLGCFLSCAYAFDDARAGMLGYLQSGNYTQWAEKIGALVSSRSYAIRRESPWRNYPILTTLPCTYCSGHGRGKGRPPIEIFHTLFSFVDGPINPE
jgi:hypothetical protein